LGQFFWQVGREIVHIPEAAVALCIFGLMRQPLFFCFPYFCNALPIKKREEEKEKEEETKKYRENVRSVWIFSLI
jgi:aconitase B